MKSPSAGSASNSNGDDWGALPHSDAPHLPRCWCLVLDGSYHDHLLPISALTHLYYAVTWALAVAIAF